MYSKSCAFLVKFSTMAPVLSKNLIRKSAVGAISVTTLFLAIKLLKKLKADGRKKYVILFDFSIKIFVCIQQLVMVETRMMLLKIGLENSSLCIPFVKSTQSHGQFSSIKMVFLYYLLGTLKLGNYMRC